MSERLMSEVEASKKVKQINQDLGCNACQLEKLKIGDVAFPKCKYANAEPRTQTPSEAACIIVGGKGSGCIFNSEKRERLTTIYSTIDSLYRYKTLQELRSLAYETALNLGTNYSLKNK
jgi:hypothetical protein